MEKQDQDNALCKFALRKMYPAVARRNETPWTMRMLADEPRDKLSLSRKPAVRFGPRLGLATDPRAVLPTNYFPPNPGSSSGSSQYFGIDIRWKFTNLAAAFECFSLW